jgi:hypothetical protein
VAKQRKAARRIQKTWLGSQQSLGTLDYFVCNDESPYVMRVWCNGPTVDGRFT